MTTASARSAVVAAGLAAALVGLLGVDAGLVWIVAGVMTIRSVAGAPIGLTWAIACVGAGVRWGTLGVADLETATRLLGPSVVTGSVPVRAGMILAAAAAVVDEAAADGLRATSWVERSAAVVAAVTLAALFLVVGPTDLSESALPWAAATAGVVTAIVVLAPFAGRVPYAARVSAAALGVVIPLVVG